MASARYEGKPFLRLLELYVLWAIDHLPQESHQTLVDMTPKLAETYGCSGEWHEIIAQQMEFPRNMPSLVHEVWEKNRRLAEENGEELDPQYFAEIFVDSNLI